eukprot:1316775-Amphidinium_carterae.1
MVRTRKRIPRAFSVIPPCKAMAVQAQTCIGTEAPVVQTQMPLQSQACSYALVASSFLRVVAAFRDALVREVILVWGLARIKPQRNKKGRIQKIVRLCERASPPRTNQFPTPCHRSRVSRQQTP